MTKHVKILDGEIVELTAEELAALNADRQSPQPNSNPSAQPQLFAAVAVNITDGAISSVEQAAQFGQLIYEDGWLMAVFAGAGDAANYMVFAQPDIPARAEQFKSEGGFELVFSDATTGDPVNPNRIDIQILKVR